jgi:hypothetical protein
LLRFLGKIIKWAILTWTNPPWSPTLSHTTEARKDGAPEVYRQVKGEPPARSSRIKISPAWTPDIDGDREKNMMAWVTGNMIALTNSGKLNKNAALYATLAAVVDAAASAVSILTK